MKSQRLNKFVSLAASGNGFTLVEVLAAVLVISVAVLGTLLTFTKSNQMMTQLHEFTVADQCIKEEIESIRDMDYDTILTLGTIFTSEGFNILNNATGTRTIDDPFGDPDIRRVIIDVTWDSPDGRELNLKRATLVTRDGINKQ